MKSLASQPLSDVDYGLQSLTELLAASLERNRQLEHALESRVVIEQAKGVLIERFRLEPDGAFDLLRRAARSSRRKLHDLAADVVRWRETPQEIMQLVVQPPPERTR